MKAKDLPDEQWQSVLQFSSPPDVSETVFIEMMPPDVRNGGGSESHAVEVSPSSGNVSEADPTEHTKLNPHTGDADEVKTSPHPYQRFIVERGGGSSGTAYNKLDHEVIDTHRKPANRIVARATRRDAICICTALNLFSRIVQR